MKNIQITLALFVILLLIASCNKGYNNSNIAYPSDIGSLAANDPSGLNALFSDLRFTPQSFTINAGTTTTITGANGTILRFYPNSFKDANGQLLPMGVVNLKLIEMYKRGDMVANRATTLANGEMLQSGGMIAVSATMGGVIIYANVYGVSFKQPDTSTLPMNIFYGSTNNIYTVATWTDGGNSSQPGTIAAGTTTSSAGTYYTIDSCTHFGWVNCARLYLGNPVKVSVNITLLDHSFNPSNTQAYLVFDEPNVHVVLSNVESGFGSSAYDAFSNKITILCQGQQNIIPVGTSFKIIVTGRKGNDYFYHCDTGHVYINSPILSQPAMTLKTKSEINNLLSSL